MMLPSGCRKQLSIQITGAIQMSKLILKAHSEGYAPTKKEFEHNSKIIEKHIKDSLEAMFEELNNSENMHGPYLLLGADMAADTINQFSAYVKKALAEQADG